MTELYTAKEVNAALKKILEEERDRLRVRGISPTLATVRIGNRSVDGAYDAGLHKKMESFQITVRSFEYPEDLGQEELIEKIHYLNADSEIHGILLFQPLPESYDSAKVKLSLAYEKDVDSAGLINLGAVVSGEEGHFAYCAPEAVLAVLDHYGISVKGKDICIIGSGLLVGRPLAMLLSNRLATVLLCNVYTKDVPQYSKQADIVICACGVPGLVGKKYLSPGQIVIDVGTTFVDGKLQGDLNREEAEGLVEAYTPTPGGIGAITTTILARHVMEAALRSPGRR